MRVLVEHKTTPSGFGLSVWYGGDDDDKPLMFATSPCCGERMHKLGSPSCKGCAKNYQKFGETNHVNLVGDFDLGESRSSDEIYEAWAQRVTGWPDLKLEVTQ